MVDTSNYLDFWDLFVNEIAGSPTVFIALALLVITYAAVRARFPNAAVVMISVLFILIMSPFIPTLQAFAVLIVCGFTGWQVARVIHR